MSVRLSPACLQYRPFFGAMLARPADHWSVLRGTLLDRYPYALPSLVVGLIPVLSVLPGLAVIKETLPKNKRRTWWSAYSSVKRKMSLTRERPRIAGPLFIWPVTYAFILWALAVVSASLSVPTILRNTDCDYRRSSPPMQPPSPRSWLSPLHASTAGSA